MSSPALRFGIVGTGVAGRYHAAAIEQTAGASLVATCRSDATRLADAITKFGVPCVPRVEALLERPDVDAICICTPSGLHAEQTVAAARAGKHVLVEKPMALTLDDADRMIAECRKHEVTLGVVFQRRTEPTYQSLREAIARGELGQVVLGSVTVPYYRPQSYYDSEVWRGSWAQDGGGALMNQGIHLTDLLLWFMGDVEQVQAHAATLAHDIEVEDTVTATLRFASGALGSLIATTAAAPGFPHSIAIYGTRGGVQLEDDRIIRREGDMLSRLGEASAARPAAGAGASPTAIGTTAHKRVVEDFVAAVRGQRLPMVTGEEGRRSLAVSLAIYEAARTGQTVRLSKSRDSERQQQLEAR